MHYHFLIHKVVYYWNNALTLLDLMILKKGDSFNFSKRTGSLWYYSGLCNNRVEWKNKISMQMSCLSLDNIYGNQAKQFADFSGFFTLGQLDEQTKFSQKNVRRAK